MATTATTRANREEAATAAPKVPWCLTFGRTDLLAACWGSKKGADLLYHFIHRASWEKSNKHKNETLKDIKFQENFQKALEKSGLSLGSFHTYLKHFVSVGYISTEAYSNEYVVHLDVIEDAFKNPPEKPGNTEKRTCKRRQPSEESFNLKDCNFVTLSRQDYDLLIELKDECFKLKEMFQSLKDEYAQNLSDLKEMFQSLKQNTTIYSNQEANVEAISEAKSNDLRDSKRNDLREKREESADALAPTPEKEIPYVPELPSMDQSSTGLGNADYTNRAGELSTSAASSPQQRAKVEPKKREPRGRKGQQEYRVYFSVEGAAVRSWYEEVFGVTLDETTALAKDCNALGKRASVTRENMTLVKGEIDQSKWIKTHNVAITPHELADDASNLRWEKWLIAAQNRKAKKKIPTREQDPYSLAALIEEQNPGFFEGGAAWH